MWSKNFNENQENQICPRGGLCLIVVSSRDSEPVLLSMYTQTGVL